MDEFTKDLIKVNWWISVVIVGFLINLGSAYLKPLLDKVFGQFWFTRKQVIEKRKEQIRKQANELLISSQRVIEWKINTIKAMVHSIFMLLLANLSFIIVSLIQNETISRIILFPLNSNIYQAVTSVTLLILGLFCLALSLEAFKSSMNNEQVLTEYRKLMKDASKPVQAPITQSNKTA